MKKLLLLLFLATASFRSYSQNLIINPSAESDPFTFGWTSVAKGTSCFTGGNWRITGNQNGYPAAQAGLQYFFSGCGSLDGELEQVISVASFATSIDAGRQNFTFSGYTQSFNQSPADGARIIVEYRNSANLVLSAYDIGNSTNTQGWVLYTNSRTAPTGTRSIRIRLISTSVNGTSVDGYFDNLSLTTAVSLPVSLLSFEAKATTQKSIFVEWETASEQDNEYYTVERSEDTRTWKALVKVDSKSSTSNFVQYYSFEDFSPLNGKSYYRLRQTDFGGLFTYSNIAAVHSVSNLTGSVSPNPATSVIHINSSNNSLMPFRITNSLGQDLTHLTNTSKELNGIISIDIATLPEGIYFINNASSSSKFYKH